MSVATWKTAYGYALTLAERQWLRNTAAAIEAVFKKPVIVNIGVLRGASMYCMRAGAQRARMVGIDIKYPRGSRFDPKLQAEFITGDSSKCHTAFKAPVHLLFVDGDHRYKGVKADINGWTPKIVPRGIIAFHDFAPAPRVAGKHAGIKRAVLEWEHKARWELLSSVGSLRAYRRPLKRT